MWLHTIIGAQLEGLSYAPIGRVLLCLRDHRVTSAWVVFAGTGLDRGTLLVTARPPWRQGLGPLLLRLTHAWCGRVLIQADPSPVTTSGWG